MPIYAYRCANCGHAQDVLQKMSDAVLTVCPACGQPSYVKQVTAAGFQLKGSGWYVTDFRSGEQKQAKPAEGADAGKPAESAGDKPAEKADAKAEGSKGRDGDSRDGKGNDGQASDAKAGDAKSKDRDSSRETQQRDSPSGETAKKADTAPPAAAAPGPASPAPPVSGPSGKTGG